MGDGVWDAGVGCGIRWGYVLALAALSVLTMPITAIWFLLLGGATLLAGAVAAALRRTPGDRAATLCTVASVAIGVLVGPAVYLSLALLT
ncbi:MAG TPA: hypothetical protein VF015_10775 [Acidimicrobiales bacterium]|jgi:hypothetical protein